MKTILSAIALLCIFNNSFAVSPIRIAVDPSQKNEYLLSNLQDNVDLIQLNADFFLIPAIDRVYGKRSAYLVSSDLCSNSYLFDVHGNLIADLCKLSNHENRDVHRHPEKLCHFKHILGVNSKSIAMTGGNGYLYTFNYSGKLEGVKPISQNRLFIPLKNNEMYSEELASGFIPKDYWHQSVVKKDIFLHYNSCDTIYVLGARNDEKKPAYIINLESEGSHVSNCMVCKNAIYLDFKEMKGEHSVLYNRETGNMLCGKLICDLFDGGDVKVVGSSDKGIILAIQDPWHLKLTDKSYSVFSKKDIRILEAINSETDFILMEVKLKNF